MNYEGSFRHREKTNFISKYIYLLHITKILLQYYIS